MPDTHHRRGEPSIPAEISKAIVGIVHDYTGRGPTMARTTIHDGLVTVLMGDSLIKAERRLVETGQADLVLRIRRTFQEAMSKDMTAAIGDLTGRRVTAFMSANHIDPDLAIEVFVLDGEKGAAGTR
jgi:uncharacterized protein YbcI